MKFITIFAIVILSASALSNHEEWLNFKKNHGKSYTNILEEKQRFAIFQSSLKQIKEHNAKYEKGEVGYYLGVTQFADMTSEEFSKFYLNYMSPKPQKPRTYADFSNIKAPSFIDWREKNVVTEVKNQAACGSCWAFSTTGSLESHNILVNNVSTLLSEQELIDCSALQRNWGCGGGLITNGFEYILYKGLSSEESYPYEAVNDACRRNRSNVVVRITDYIQLPELEDALKNVLASFGPVSVAMYGREDFKLYKGGIYDNEECVNNRMLLNHAVLAVGYGVQDDKNKKDYWIVKNSWGETWGDNGFFKLSRNPSVCGVYLDASYPVVIPN